MNLRNHALSLSLLMVIAGMGSASAQDTPGAKQDMKNAGSDTKAAAQNTGDATKKAANKTGHAAKKATNKGAQKTKQGAQKVQDKTQPNPPQNQ
jgi:hypothetical protein